jgi:hypothetical protein
LILSGTHDRADRACHVDCRAGRFTCCLPGRETHVERFPDRATASTSQQLASGREQEDNRARRRGIHFFKEITMQHHAMPPDLALADHPKTYSDPELKEYADEQAEDILESIVQYMPLALPLMAAILIFMLAFIAVFMA